MKSARASKANLKTRVYTEADFFCALLSPAASSYTVITTQTKLIKCSYFFYKSLLVCQQWSSVSKGTVTHHFLDVY